MNTEWRLRHFPPAEHEAVQRTLISGYVWVCADTTDGHYHEYYRIYCNTRRYRSLTTAMTGLAYATVLQSIPEGARLPPDEFKQRLARARREVACELGLEVSA